MKIEKNVVGIIKTNCYLVSINGNCFLIDPGGDAAEIIKKLKNLKLEFILLTHGHFDHLLAVQEVIDAFPDTTIYINPKENPIIKFTPNQAKAMGLNITDFNLKFKSIQDGDEVNFEGKKIKVIATPGHTPGSVCYLLDNTLFSGDTLFKQNIGRTDLLGGDSEQIKQSLNKLAQLPDDTRVLPGHGPDTNIDHEKQFGYL
jgi:hydroxyacylglutathione hydrolase